ncbi:MAG: NAD-dependent epimerase/dehydratase family protein [Alphaproteobacteria bacterium]
MPRFNRVLVIGGGGYVGAVLVPKLLDAGYSVRVFDLFIYGEDVFSAVRKNPRLELVKGDVRDAAAVDKATAGCDAVIHLACISNDPSFELDPELGKSINLDSFRPTVKAAKKAGVKRFIYASSSSVYGVKEGVAVTEDLPCEPLTDYSKFKVACEKILTEEREPGFVTVILRPATVCGYSPRQRLDVIVNILTNHAVNNGKIKVMGGAQLRPNIHIEDMCRAYLAALELPDAQVDGVCFNAGYENHSVQQLADMVKRVVGPQVQMDVVPTDDPRSYHVSSDRIRKAWDFVPVKTIEDAVRDLVAAFKAGKLPNAMSNPMYYNIRRMQELKLK